MSTILSTGVKNCISVNYVIAHIATGRISRIMQNVMKSSIQVICVKYAIKIFIYSLTIGAMLLQHILLWIQIF